MKMSSAQQKSIKTKATFLGKTFKSKDCGDFTVLDYLNSKQVLIQFNKTKSQKWCELKAVRSGGVKDPNFPSIYGVGFIGEGEFSSRFVGGANTPCYDSWRGMLRRCYSEESLIKSPTYAGCSVAEEWHNFQNFAAWYYENLKGVSGKVHLDKDILKKGNKIYCKENCCLVNVQINSLFTGASIVNRGKYPLGVFLRKRNGMFVAQVTKGNGAQEFLGEYNTPEQAFYVYKKHKEDFVKQVANKYKDSIREDVYLALMNYTVSIED